MLKKLQNWSAMVSISMCFPMTCVEQLKQIGNIGCVLQDPVFCIALGFFPSFLMATVHASCSLGTES